MRQRRKRGERVELVVVRDDQVVVVVDKGTAADALRDAQLIRDWDIEDRAAVEAGVLEGLKKLARATRGGSA
jgi:hypothetical protein